MSTPSRPGIVGRLISTLFFLIFLALGLGFTIAVARSVWQNALTYRWVRVECTIVESQLAPRSMHDSTPEWRVRYRYLHGGRDYTSSVITRGITKSRDTAELRRRFE